MKRVIVFVLAACSSTPALGPGGGTAAPPAWVGLAGDRMAPLPPFASGRSDRFVTSEACAQCHSAGTNVQRDASGRDVSPPASWRASMMANAARDPFYLAQVSYELALHPEKKDSIEATCTPCHAPAAAVDLAANGAHVTFADLASATTPMAHLARDGVTCSLCHQISAKGLGTDASFDARFEIGTSRTIYGPHASPLTLPMQTFVNYTPAQGLHIGDSGLCGSCHTVITGQFVEQGAYLEWANSDFLAGAKAGSCQSCHVPQADEDGKPITTILSLQPNQGLSPRNPIGRHIFAGGNVQLLSVMSDNRDWTGSPASALELLAAAARAQQTLKGAARMTIDRASRGNGALVVDVTVENQSGHKFPTGYPSRRAWLHVRATDGDRVVFESGAWDSYGRIVDRNGLPIDGRDAVRPHLDVVDDGRAQIWEMVPGDGSGVARSLLSATTVLKDDRLLPAGWSANGLRANLTAPVGVKDANFGARDTVSFRIVNPPAHVHVVVELVFQSVRPSELETLAQAPTPAARSFLDMIQKRSEPFVLARLTADN